MKDQRYHNGIIKSKAEKNAELNIVLVNLMNIKSNNFLAIENDFGENAKINYTIVLKTKTPFLHGVFRKKRRFFAYSDFSFASFSASRFTLR